MGYDTNNGDNWWNLKFLIAILFEISNGSQNKPNLARNNDYYRKKVAETQLSCFLIDVVHALNTVINKFMK